MDNFHVSADQPSTPLSIENETQQSTKLRRINRRKSFENEKVSSLIPNAARRSGARIQSCLDALFKPRELLEADDYILESPTARKKSRLHYRVYAGKDFLKARASRTRSDSFLSSSPPSKISPLPAPINLPKRRIDSARLRAAIHLDGSSDAQRASNDPDNDLEPIHSLPTPPGSPTNPSTKRRRKNHASHYSVDLTLPDNSTLPESFNHCLDTPSPWTQASPAKGAFPFPASEKRQSVLSPFPLWSSGSRLRPTPRTSGGYRSVSYSPSQSPDRFLPTRRPGSTRESFELSRPPEKLTESERLARTKEVGPDPFGRRIRSNASRFISRLRPSASHSAPSASPAGANSLLGFRRNSTGAGTRLISSGAIWNVGGTHAASEESIYAVSDGRGGLMASGTNAPLHSANFLSRADPARERDAHERRLALALDVDTSARIMAPGSYSSVNSSLDAYDASTNLKRTTWTNNEWTKEGSVALLDAPALRDDFYCSVLAYSSVAKVLAVGLNATVYLWNESGGTDSPPALNPANSAHITSLSFSSKGGGSAILAVGRASGQVMLYSPFDDEPRFDSNQPSPICCVSFRPTATKRLSRRDQHIIVNTEELLVGDEAGNVYFYVIEWPSPTDRDIFNWPGSLTLTARITVHTQQICGLAWSNDGSSFATGGNDNLCHLFDTDRVLAQAARAPADESPTDSPSRSSNRRNVNLSSSSFSISALFARHRFTLSAAVKAIAFCPWQRGLLAVGGGSNDRSIHFFHTLSGAALATLDCHAQVTSLIWSTTRREIAATFGFAQPDHPYRIAVFKWPSCELVVKIPWFDEHRALFAIPYPGGPNIGRSGSRASSRGSTSRGRRAGSRYRERGAEGGVWWSRTQEEGCLCVATSDCSIKFHEVWAEERRATSERDGMLGGSDILDLVHGIEKEGGQIIR